MQYADSLRKVLIRKITKAERDLAQLKLDYCRFVFGLSHRSQVKVKGKLYLVRTVDVDTMDRVEGGEFSKPAIAGVPVGSKNAETELRQLGKNWVVVTETEVATAL